MGEFMDATEARAADRAETFDALSSPPQTGAEDPEGSEPAISIAIASQEVSDSTALSPVLSAAAPVAYLPNEIERPADAYLPRRSRHKLLTITTAIFCP